MLVNAQIADFLALSSANIFNLLILGIMLSRPKGWTKLEHYLGLVNIALVLPLSFTATFYAINGSNLWQVVLPGLMILFLMVELILDYLLKLDFRQSRWLGLYLLLFYVAQWGMIGFSFMVGRVPGFITLLTYFLSLAATAYSYAKVGHGEKSQ